MLPAVGIMWLVGQVVSVHLSLPYYSRLVSLRTSYLNHNGQSAVQIALSAEESRFAMLEPIRLTIKLINTSDQDKCIWHGAPWNGFLWELVDEAGNEIPMKFMSALGSRGPKVIPPGGTHVERVFLNEFFDLTVSGKYWVRIATRQPPAELLESLKRVHRASQFERAKSNVLELEIQPKPTTRPNNAPNPQTVGGTSNREGIRLDVKHRGTRFSRFEPIELTVQLTNDSTVGIGIEDTRPFQGQTYIVRRKLESGTLRDVGRTRFGGEVPGCMHRLTAPLPSGASHRDEVILNRLFDMTRVGKYEFSVVVRVATEVPDNPIIITSGQIVLEISDQPFQVED